MNETERQIAEKLLKRIEESMSPDAIESTTAQSVLDYREFMQAIRLRLDSEQGPIPQE